MVFKVEIGSITFVIFSPVFFHVFIVAEKLFQVGSLLVGRFIGVVG